MRALHRLPSLWLYPMVVSVAIDTTRCCILTTLKQQDGCGLQCPGTDSADGDKRFTCMGKEIPFSRRAQPFNKYMGSDGAICINNTEV